VLRRIMRDRVAKVLFPLALILMTGVTLAGSLHSQTEAGKSDVPIAAPAAPESDVKKTTPYADADLSIKITPSANNTFGYDILISGKPLVHQPHIPGLPGNEGFTTKERAKKVAEFVVSKIRRNEMPPTVTVADLDGMGVLK
jgi:hypothetical protein